MADTPRLVPAATLTARYGAKERTLRRLANKHAVVVYRQTGSLAPLYPLEQMAALLHTPPADGLISLREAQNLYGLSDSTVRRKARKAQVPKHRVPGLHEIFYDAEALAKALSPTEEDHGNEEEACSKTSP